MNDVRPMRAAKQRAILCMQLASAPRKPAQFNHRARSEVNFSSASVVGGGVTVQPSRIPNGGRGLFAARRFSSGDVITEYYGVIVDLGKPTVQPLAPTHILTVTRDCVIDASGGRSRPGLPAGGFANDPRGTGQGPNTEFVRTTAAAGPGVPPSTNTGERIGFRMWLVALRGAAWGRSSL